MNSRTQVIVVAVVALIVGLAIGQYGGATRQTSAPTVAPSAASTSSVMMMGNAMHGMPDGMMVASTTPLTMESMMHDMMAALNGKTGDDFDKAFLKEMIVHHEGAVEMAKAVLTSSNRRELKAMANDIISAQTKEIQQMTDWQKRWFGQ